LSCPILRYHSEKCKRFYDRKRWLSKAWRWKKTWGSGKTVGRRRPKKMSCDEQGERPDGCRVDEKGVPVSIAGGVS